YQKLCLQLSAAALLEVCVRFPQSAVRAKLPVIRMCGSCRAQLAVLQEEVKGKGGEIKTNEKHQGKESNHEQAKETFWKVIE
ncbi:MAG: hypothetical protein VZT48_06390, partial [Bulleidia sp.]|nr:hypothetical protein [Bulleidia sp.]